MKRFLLLALVGGILFGLVIGCDSDDKSTDNSLAVGDTNSIEFQFVSDFLGEQSFDELNWTIDLTFDLLGSIPGEQAPKFKEISSFASGTQEEVLVLDSADYQHTNGWHIFEFYATVMGDEDTTDVAGIDSVRTMVNGVPTQTPDITLNELSIRAHYNWENRQGLGNGSGDHSLDLDGTVLVSGSQVVVNGASTDGLVLHLEDGTTVCDLEVSNSVTATALAFRVDVDECPTSGTFQVTSTVSLACTGQGDSELDSLNINGSWVVTAVFNGNLITITYSDGTTAWTITDICGDSST